MAKNNESQSAICLPKRRFRLPGLRGTAVTASSADSGFKTRPGSYNDAALIVFSRGLKKHLRGQKAILIGMDCRRTKAGA
jgi:hypothetical protein